MNGLIQNIKRDFNDGPLSSGSHVEVYVLDAQGDPFTIYRGNPIGLTEEHLQAALRNPGTFYIFSVIATENSVDIGTHHSTISRREFCWLTNPDSPVLTGRGPRSLSVKWEPINYCGIQDDAKEKAMESSSIEYILEGAEGFEWKNSKNNRFVTDLPGITEFKELCRGPSLCEAFLVDLKPSWWYHLRLVIEYPGFRATSSAISVHTLQDVPETPKQPRASMLLHASLTDASQETNSKVKITWQAPCSNGADILKYQLQIQEITLGKFSSTIMQKPGTAPATTTTTTATTTGAAAVAGKGVDAAKSRSTHTAGPISSPKKAAALQSSSKEALIATVFDEFSHSEQHDNNNNNGRPVTGASINFEEFESDYGLVKKSPWTTIMYGLRHDIALPLPSKDSLHWEIRVRALNSVGWSDFSPVLIVDASKFPSLFPRSL